MKALAPRIPLVVGEPFRSNASWALRRIWTQGKLRRTVHHLISIALSSESVDDDPNPTTALIRSRSLTLSKCRSVRIPTHHPRAIGHRKFLVIIRSVGSDQFLTWKRHRGKRWSYQPRKFKGILHRTEDPKPEPLRLVWECQILSFRLLKNYGFHFCQGKR